MGKKYVISVSRKMYGILEDGAKRTGLSLREFADQVLQAKTEGSFMAKLGNSAPDDQLIAEKDAKGHYLSPDGKHILLENLGLWSRA